MDARESIFAAGLMAALLGEPMDEYGCLRAVRTT